MRMVLISLLCAAPVMAEPRSLAVLEFRNKLSPADRAAVDAGYLAGQVRTAAVESAPSVRVITKENLLVLLQSTGKDLESCEGECEVETGRRIGADLVVSGELLKFGSQYKLDMRLHDTHEGRMLSGATASGESADALDRALAPAIQKLLLPLGLSGGGRQALAGRAPLLVQSRGVLGASASASFNFSIENAAGRVACDEPVTTYAPCRLFVPAGPLNALVGGERNMDGTFNIPPRGGIMNIHYTGRALLWAGLITTVAGGIGIVVGAAASSDGGKIAGYTAGGMAAFVGLGLLLSHLVVSSAGNRLTFDEAEK